MTYCGKVGYEYAHVHGNDRKNFIRSKIEVVQDVPSKDMTLKRWSVWQERTSSRDSWPQNSILQNVLDLKVVTR